ncbi:MAG: DUF2812 domain-containing protein [Gulosibacter sp.]|uniref:DUF2812 domain-containing protein n=1 Tax=Gulosibacter sp. TaxID=2817531 RepID=UPI003F932DEC
MKKFRVFTNFDHEEAWLNDMAQQGHILQHAGFRYEFAQLPEGSAAPVIRVDYRPEMSEQDHTDYVTLFEDAGWRHLDGSRKGGAQYFAQHSPNADAEIFSDAESKAKRYQRAIAARSTALFVLVIAAVILLQSGNLFTSPASWYLTPGIWEMEGIEFVNAFAFESIFVFFRNILPILIIALCAVLLWQTARQYLLMRQGKRLARDAA